MQGEKKERWICLCEQASTEQDSEKLVALAQEIARLLEEKQTRLALAVTDGQNPVSPAVQASTSSSLADARTRSSSASWDR
jgi:hypothetical protein